MSGDYKRVAHEFLTGEAAALAQATNEATGKGEPITDLLHVGALLGIGAALVAIADSIENGVKR